MTSRTELILVRHGHTAANAGGLDVPMSGATNVPLAAMGVSEAHATAEFLSRRGPFARVFSSPLDRALTTARMIAQRCGVDLQLVEGLSEIDCGTIRSRLPLARRGKL